MKRSARPPCPTISATPDASADPDVSTVASLGVRLRLIPNERDQELARLIRSCEVLRAESERLFRRIIDLLDEDHRGSEDDGPSFRSDV